MDKIDYYAGFYEVLEQSILNCVRSKMAFTLTGGWDTRLIAGILAANDIRLVSVTWGSALEKTIASKIAAVLNFEHYAVYPAGSVFAKLREHGFQYLLTGALFDEINGGWTGAKAKTCEEFRYAQAMGLEMRSRGFEQYYRNNKYPIWWSPLFDENVVKYLETIPWYFRVGKQIQRWILKTKYPNLWQIPYYDSLLPNFLPYRIHGMCSILHFLKGNIRVKMGLTS